MITSNHPRLDKALNDGIIDLTAVWDIVDKFGLKLPPDTDLDDVLDWGVNGTTIGKIVEDELDLGPESDSAPSRDWLWSGVDEADYERMMLNSGDAGTHESLTY